MKMIGLIVLVAAVLAFTLPVLLLDADLGVSQVLAKEGDKKDGDKKDDEKKDDEKKKDDKEDGDDGGGSKFDDDDGKKDDKKKIPDKPVPKTYSLADYRLEFTIEDSRFWKQDKNYTAKETEQGVCLKMVLKLPKSDDHFDVNLFCQGIEHKMQLSWEDGTKIGAANFKGIAQKHFEDDIAAWKDTKEITKPKSIKLSRDLGKVYFYSFTGMSPGGSYPLHRARYYMKFKDKTYILSVLYTTTSYKNKKIREVVDKLLKSFKEKKKKRR